MITFKKVKPAKIIEADHGIYIRYSSTHWLHFTDTDMNECGLALCKKLEKKLLEYESESWSR